MKNEVLRPWGLWPFKSVLALPASLPPHPRLSLLEHKEEVVAAHSEMEVATSQEKRLQKDTSLASTLTLGVPRPQNCGHPADGILLQRPEQTKMPKN